MKICPKCGTSYKDEIRYCLNDGSALAVQMVEDYEEPETVVRSEPIIIDFAKPETPSEPMLIDFSDVETVVHPPKSADAMPPVTVIEKPVVKTGNYAVFLIAGLFLGGALVLATLLLARSYFRSDNSNSVNAVQTNQTVVTSTANSTDQAIQNAAAKHAAPNPSADVNALNGKVIAVNAYVRALPNKDSAEIDVLPIGDRLEIGARENSSSPWYQIKCEHGTSGWMHGNTIAFD